MEAGAARISFEVVLTLTKNTSVYGAKCRRNINNLIVPKKVITIDYRASSSRIRSLCSSDQKGRNNHQHDYGHLRKEEVCEIHFAKAGWEGQTFILITTTKYNLHLILMMTKMLTATSAIKSNKNAGKEQEGSKINRFQYDGDRVSLIFFMEAAILDCQ